jgi:hypothetical protein
LPGPGKYEQKRLFDDVSKKPSEILGIEYERPPFGVQTRVLIKNYFYYLI